MAKLYETITAENWCQHALFDGRGRACLTGHFEKVKEACGRDVHAWGPQWIALMEAVFAISGKDVVSFNNDPQTTVEDIIRACKVAEV